MNLVPASTLPIERLAALFTASYEGYLVPIRVEAATLAGMVEAWDIDLAKSRVAFEARKPVGLALLAVRDDRSWIGGMGVVASARRRGFGRALMEGVLAQPSSLVTLEVIEENEAAIRLYERLGFRRRRMLEIWSLAAAAAAPKALRVSEPRPLGQADLPWQREDVSLPSEYERIEVDGGAALIRVVDNQTTVLQLDARNEATAAQLLAGARSRGELLRYVNVPEGDPASGALRHLGGRLELRQLEMTLVRPTS
jgi:ribosomal protein S18 acetylase RimI-like enzyme